MAGSASKEYFARAMQTASERRAIFALLLHAALADGVKSGAERAALRRITTGFEGEEFNPWLVYQEVLEGRFAPEAAAIYLTTPASRRLAYEMAVGVCETDGPPNGAERAFLGDLREALGLGAEEMDTVEQSAQAVAQAVPAAAPQAALAVAGGPRGADSFPGASSGAAAWPSSSVDVEALERSVLRHAILAGALELLPQSLATMAVVPLQMKLVYSVGRAHGYTLDRGHVRDFLATAGAGLAAQAVEGYARKLLGGLVGSALGRGALGSLARGAVNSGAGAALTFAATYAIGRLAIRYYGGGRKMEMAVLKDTYASLLSEGRTLFGRHRAEVEQRASTLTPGEVINLVRAE
jgi:uncharacterized protein (DUF697 family)